MEYERIRKRLTEFYFDELPKEAERVQKKVFSRMDEYAEKYSDRSSYHLKAKLYESIADEIQPTVFSEIPFFFETGALVAHSDGKYNRGGLHANGWLYLHNHQLFIDADPHNYGLYKDDVWKGLYAQTGTYVDMMHYGIPMKKVFSVGLCGVMTELNEALSQEYDPQKREFLESAVAGVNALYTIEKKFAVSARKAGMEELAAIADRVPWNAPKTFHEGLCAMAFMRKALGALEGVGFNSFGRVDVLLAPLYEADLARGVSREELYSLVAKFLLIWDCTLDRRSKLVGGYEYEKENTLTLGGCDQNGEPVFNDVTRIFLEARNELGAVYPKMMLRYSAASPREYIDLIGAPLLENKSFSLFENDDAVIPALVAAGVEYSDAVDYVVGGCWDAITPEVSAKFSGEYFNILKPLEWWIYRMHDEMDARGLFYEGIEDTTSFEQLYATYIENVKKLLIRKGEILSRGSRRWHEVNPLCTVSALLETCIPRRTDLTAGGGKYNWDCLYFSYFGDVADSLLAIKKLCFDEKVCTLSQLFDECRKNWQSEPLRRRAIGVCSYGDGLEESSRFVGKLFDDLYEATRGMATAYGGEYRVGSNQYTEVIFCGKETRATPNGRKDGDYLSMGLSPSRLQAPVSAVEILDSLRYIDLKKCAGNTSLTLTLPAGRMDKERLADFLYASARSGVQGLQPNCVNKAMLLKAQKEPENHGHIIVRVCGFSAPFVLLSEEYQNEFISRLSEESSQWA